MNNYDFQYMMPGEVKIVPITIDRPARSIINAMHNAARRNGMQFKHRLDDGRVVVTKLDDNVKEKYKPKGYKRDTNTSTATCPACGEKRGFHEYDNIRSDRANNGSFLKHDHVCTRCRNKEFNELSRLMK